MTDLFCSSIRQRLVSDFNDYSSLAHSINLSNVFLQPEIHNAFYQCSGEMYESSFFDCIIDSLDCPHTSRRELYTPNKMVEWAPLEVLYNTFNFMDVPMSMKIYENSLITLERFLDEIKLTPTFRSDVEMVIDDDKILLAISQVARFIGASQSIRLCQFQSSYTDDCKKNRTILKNTYVNLLAAAHLMNDAELHIRDGIFYSINLVLYPIFMVLSSIEDGFDLLTFSNQMCNEFSVAAIDFVSDIQILRRSLLSMSIETSFRENFKTFKRLEKTRSAIKKNLKDFENNKDSFDSIHFKYYLTYYHAIALVNILDIILSNDRFRRSLNMEESLKALPAIGSENRGKDVQFHDFIQMFTVDENLSFTHTRAPVLINNLMKLMNYGKTELHKLTSPTVNALQLSIEDSKFWNGALSRRETQPMITRKIQSNKLFAAEALAHELKLNELKNLDNFWMEKRINSDLVPRQTKSLFDDPCSAPFVDMFYKKSLDLFQIVQPFSLVLQSYQFANKHTMQSLIKFPWEIEKFESTLEAYVSFNNKNVPPSSPNAEMENYDKDDINIMGRKVTESFKKKILSDFFNVNPEFTLIPLPDPDVTPRPLLSWLVQFTKFEAIIIQMSAALNFTNRVRKIMGVALGDRKQINMHYVCLKILAAPLEAFEVESMLDPPLNAIFQKIDSNNFYMTNPHDLHPYSPLALSKWASDLVLDLYKQAKIILDESNKNDINWLLLANIQSRLFEIFDNSVVIPEISTCMMEIATNIGLEFFSNVESCFLSFKKIVNKSSSTVSPDTVFNDECVDVLLRDYVKSSPVGDLIPVVSSSSMPVENFISKLENGSTILDDIFKKDQSTKVLSNSYLDLYFKISQTNLIRLQAFKSAFPGDEPISRNYKLNTFVENPNLFTIQANDYSLDSNISAFFSSYSKININFRNEYFGLPRIIYNFIKELKCLTSSKKYPGCSTLKISTGSLFSVPFVNTLSKELLTVKNGIHSFVSTELIPDIDLTKEFEFSGDKKKSANKKDFFSFKKSNEANIFSIQKLLSRLFDESYTAQISNFVHKSQLLSLYSNLLKDNPREIINIFSYFYKIFEEIVFATEENASTMAVHKTLHLPWEASPFDPSIDGLQGTIGSAVRLSRNFSAILNDDPSGRGIRETQNNFGIDPMYSYMDVKIGDIFIDDIDSFYIGNRDLITRSTARFIKQVQTSSDLLIESVRNFIAQIERRSQRSAQKHSDANIAPILIEDSDKPYDPNDEYISELLEYDYLNVKSSSPDFLYNLHQRIDSSMLFNLRMNAIDFEHISTVLKSTISELGPLRTLTRARKKVGASMFTTKVLATIYDKSLEAIRDEFDSLLSFASSRGGATSVLFFLQRLSKSKMQSAETALSWGLANDLDDSISLSCSAITEWRAQSELHNSNDLRKKLLPKHAKLFDLLFQINELRMTSNSYAMKSFIESHVSKCEEEFRDWVIANAPTDVQRNCLESINVLLSQKQMDLPVFVILRFKGALQRLEYWFGSIFKIEAVMHSSSFSDSNFDDVNDAISTLQQIAQQAYELYRYYNFYGLHVKSFVYREIFKSSIRRIKDFFYKLVGYYISLSERHPQNQMMRNIGRFILKTLKSLESHLDVFAYGRTGEDWSNVFNTPSRENTAQKNFKISLIILSVGIFFIMIWQIYKMQRKPSENIFSFYKRLYKKVIKGINYFIRKWITKKNVEDCNEKSSIIFVEEEDESSNDDNFSNLSGYYEDSLSSDSDYKDENENDAQDETHVENSHSQNELLNISNYQQNDNSTNSNQLTDNLKKRRKSSFWTLIYPFKNTNA